MSKVASINRYSFKELGIDTIFYIKNGHVPKNPGKISLGTAALVGMSLLSLVAADVPVPL